ncbi:MAG: hypothetical protein A2418_03540 [Candidatus Brennerbacteria bacterium RIFOXYC1_FULL_41_11]|uniref:P-type Cu(+) transporter n=1 Tax=Candidatus Brennerbacteria bacterium RIFOXYD1_FULL_41_16 TaxID=1797529 RepID=A0A1G1XKA4_9BACT|nr:MAG: hypothetical protein A2418_03540 [Candidatus Brennerbacteria bacterium RIFOXYC1_FULL_41_11]OGY40533.1 MAG: hypothetical protein A2570_02205 [Candidatus Brennerbacteria bacterium RIFOXYD1_FULL_41_16]
MITNTYRVKGMHCASCSSVIEKTLKKVEGVDSVTVNLVTEKAKVSFDASKTNLKDFSKRLESLGYSLTIDGEGELSIINSNLSTNDHADHAGNSRFKGEKLAELSQMRNKVLSIMPLAFFSVLIMTWDALIRFGIAPEMSGLVYEFIHHLLPILATYALFVVGKPYLLGLIRFFRFGKANMDTLIGLGTTVAFLYSFIISAFKEPLRQFINVENVYYDITIVVIAFIALGKYLETKAKLKTGDAIEKLLNLQVKTAVVIKNGQEKELPIDQILHGDEIIIKPGSNIPVDGIIISGSSFVDEAMITGESIPVEKIIGDTVVAGTINTTKSFVFKATRVGKETLLARIIQMVEDAQNSRAPIQALVDKISSIFVPVVIVIALLSLFGWLIIGTKFLGFSQALSFGLVSFVSVLVIACPCALGLATPTAIIVGVGKGAKEGILIKDATTLEKLQETDFILFDKTGTITNGEPKLVGLRNFSNISDKNFIEILAALENRSEHPISRAILDYAKTENILAVAASEFEIIKGRGVRGEFGGTEYFAGNVQMAVDLGLKVNLEEINVEAKQGKTPVVLMTKKEIVGVVMVADTIKPEAKQAIKDLHDLGIKTMMLTGDHQNTAQAIAKEVGIDEVLAEVMPGDKLKKIQELQNQGFVVTMVGDGINDAPALAQADVSVAMGNGTDVAIEAAGITFLRGDISKIVKAIKLSRLTISGIKQNLFWAFIYNLVGVPLATGVFYPVFGWLLNPVFAGLAMAFSSVSVVGNSLRLKTKKI